MIKNQQGMLAIETLISFVAMLLLMAFMAVWVNASAMQLRTHRALTQTALEISIYAHALEMVGAVDGLRRMYAHLEPRRSNINEFLEHGFGVWDSVSSVPTYAIQGDLDQAVHLIQEAEESLGNVFGILGDWGDELSEDPMAFFLSLLQVGAAEGLQTGLNAFIGYLVVPSFFWRYMGVAERRPETYRVAGISAQNIEFIWWDFLATARGGVGTGFNEGVSFLTGPNGDQIILSARFNLDIGAYLNTDILFVTPNMPVTQQVMTRGWVGDGGRFQYPEGKDE